MCTTIFRLITDYTFSMLAFLSRMPVRNKALNCSFALVTLNIVTLMYME